MVWFGVPFVRALPLPIAVVGALLSPLTSPLVASASPGELAPDDRPRGTYVWVPPSPSEASPAPAQKGGSSGQHILYLNRCNGGATITAGWPDDNQLDRSGILGGTVNFPPYPYGDDSWAQVVEHTKQIYAPFGIHVTDVDPSPTPHDEAIVCGSGGMAGFGGAGGVAPFTCDVIPDPITFTFPESLGNDPRTIAEVIAQESAHAWGLEHEYKCEDPMTYLSGCGDKTFQDGNYQCGEYSPRACDCGGATQNSYQYIMSLFGPSVPDVQAPTATIVAPHDGETFSVGDSFDVAVEVADDNEVVRVSLYLDGALSSEDMSVPFGPWPVIDAPEGAYEFYIVATDAAGKTTQSNVVHVEVTADPVDPGHPNGGGGAEGGGEGGGDEGGGDTDSGDAEGDGEGDDGALGPDDPGALPPGFGLDTEAAGCACTTAPGRTPPLGWLGALVIVGALERRRRLLSRRRCASCS